MADWIEYLINSWWLISHQCDWNGSIPNCPVEICYRIHLSIGFIDSDLSIELTSKFNLARARESRANPIINRWLIESSLTRLSESHGWFMFHGADSIIIVVPIIVMIATVVPSMTSFWKRNGSPSETISRWWTQVQTDESTTYNQSADIFFSRCFKFRPELNRVIGDGFIKNFIFEFKNTRTGSDIQWITGDEFDLFAAD